MTATFSVSEAKSRFYELVRRAEGGEEIVITRNGRPVARLLPLAGPVRPAREPGEPQHR